MLHKHLEIGSSPHFTSGARVDAIMLDVIIALVPVSLFAVYAFGLAGALILATATVSCVATEHVICRIKHQPSTVGDWSIAITGLLYGLTLPPELPLWMVALGGVFGVTVGKAVFGGLGCNVFNPALVGRAFLQAAFPQAMTHWQQPFAADRFTELPSTLLTLPFAEPRYDAVSAATPLSRMKFETIQTANPDLLLGLTSGSTGETCAALILLGGVYLVVRKSMNWRIPVSILLTVALLTAVLQQVAPASSPSPSFMLLSGGLMLGAVFMATDLVASPITHAGCWLYGAVIGALVVVIRIWGGMPEGVMYAILLANTVSPHIDKLIQPRVFGTGRSSR
ncbi:MAG: RnfABCDGE type electron transport complex subunit D [Gammaproteobacteria bacterium]|nr:RnfABCDGE type electron transport complex subunit D [Gammaproteobacteria bacterium]